MHRRARTNEMFVKRRIILKEKRVRSDFVERKKLVLFLRDVIFNNRF